MRSPSNLILWKRGSQIFTAQMTSGEMFRRLDPEKQRLAAEKMAQMRPLFRYVIVRVLLKPVSCELRTTDYWNVSIAVMSWRS